ncbi:septal ring lytic transglycosylase RlpA family protein [Micromonospora sp. HM5-17]|uniref:septal ring lytic transglycosylase RlpA family protein n=1 Tax=Micromonospora sp. HM5-17 TaxID=2487710 RepID=UPI000F4A3A68|nr:septal ring lytic transglycosylase RlpA family protein [Micromonospora sp. HM5-17]ROT33721.1 septal ring lytic transglycosylase RlpA family protein [Micromonospora sp. HM5-17]
MAGRHARVRFRSRTGLVASGAVALALLGAGAAGAVQFGVGEDPPAVPPMVDAATPAASSLPTPTATTATPAPATATPSRSPERASRSSPRPTPSHSLAGARSSAAKRATTKPTASPKGEQVVGSGSCGASYYDQGQVTANGEAFDPNALTAAHKTLPFNTRVRVTNPENNRSVVVRINDRGPFVEGRCLDLSRAAFEAIAPLSVGALTVRYEILG